jgi:hypothetical protein
MGKHSRRKSRQKPKQSPEDGDAPRNPSSAVHQLRHPDPKMRHGALVALQANFLHEGSKQVSLPVLQAVREQVMDTDMNCASTAAECLAQYISYAEEDKHKDVMASWTLIIIARLDQCHQAILAKPNNVKPWYALAAPCLRALCRLIETNELALNQMNLSKQTFLSTVFGLLQASASQEATLDPNLTEWVLDTAAYAARCIHSSIDDNFEMVDIINGNKKIIELWPSLLTSLPNMAQLHLAGCIVSLYQAAPAPWQSSCIMNEVLPCLSRFMAVDEQNLRTLEENYRQAKLLWTSQKEDDEMEKEILQTIEKRREPTRDIARRLKTTTRKGKAVMDNQEDGRQAMEDSLSEWNNVIMPLQLALEVMANLLSCLIQDDDNISVERDDGVDRLLRQTLVTNKVAECIVRMLQNLCVYKKSRPEKENELLQDDLQETVDKLSACLANCVLSKVLAESDFVSTWSVLRQHPTEKGVGSVMAAMVQNSKSLRELAVHDLEIFQGMLHNPDDEEIQRDAVCLVSAALAGNPTTEVVTKFTSELIKLMGTAAIAVKCEVLNTVMDLYGEDDFHPQVFMALDTLNHIQQCIMTVPQKDLGPEEEEILSNANRFVEYKLGQ